MAKGIPPQLSILPILFDERRCIDFLIQRNIIFSEMICPQCRSCMNLQINQKCLRRPKKIAKRKSHFSNKNSFLNANFHARTL
jgi:hypothetical protein